VLLLSVNGSRTCGIIHQLKKMIKNYFKIAWRNMIRDKQFTFLNVFGLSAGLACTLLIWFWVNDELSVDKSFEKDGQIYQLLEHRKTAGQSPASDESSGMLAEVIAQRMPEVEYAAALAPHEWFQKFTLSAGEKNIKAYGQYAGKDYFNIFSFRLVDGKKDQILAAKNSIAISDELALKLFGTTENLIGKAIRFQHERDFFVSGVFEKPDPHSSQQFDFVLSFEYMKDVYPWVTSWNNTGPHNFVLLKKGTDINAFNKRIAGIVAENSNDTTRSAFAAPFADNYLLYTFSHGSQTGSKMGYIKLFSLIAIFILAIACINFMNLSTAKASRRMKEVGIKKVMGAERWQLILQFLSESIIYSAIAMILALILVLLLLPSFNNLTGKEIVLSFNLKIIFTLVGITIITGLLSGSYPALYLSGFNPISILKGSLQTSIAELLSRRGLVVFQFTLSALLIVSVLVVYRQVRFVQSTNPGYNKENVIRFNSEGNVLKSEDVFMDQIKKIPGVVNACYTWHEMIGRNYGDYNLSWDGKNPNEAVYLEGFGGGYGFIETMGMHMVAGRAYSKAYGDETSKIILNEAAIKMMHITDPIGKTVHYGNNPRQIIGVVQDFHYESLHEVVKPCFITLDAPGNIWHKMMVRIKGGDQEATLNAIRHLYESYNPGFPFDYNFLDEAYQKQYLTETRVGILSRYFAGLAILISCLGLFGLATFTAQKRRKEIGIRKVVGASVNSIVVMLSKDFLKLVLVSVIIAFPLAWWFMHQWLQSFAYRVDIGPEVFLITGTCVVFITLLTISIQALKAALVNPVSSLRSE
jgi:putative ABC transport system permease protein